MSRARGHNRTANGSDLSLHMLADAAHQAKSAPSESSNLAVSHLANSTTYNTTNDKPDSELTDIEDEGLGEDPHGSEMLDSDVDESQGMSHRYLLHLSSY